MFQRLTTRIAIFRLCRVVRREALSLGVAASVSWFGAYWVHPKHLVVVVRVRSDPDKSKLLNDRPFLAYVRSYLAAVGYPLTGRDEVVFEVESQETVDREWNGNWWYRFK